jgi:hypothetical protein
LHTTVVDGTADGRSAERFGADDDAGATLVLAAEAVEIRAVDVLDTGGLVGEPG